MYFHIFDNIRHNVIHSKAEHLTIKLHLPTSHNTPSKGLCFCRQSLTLRASTILLHAADEGSSIILEHSWNDVSRIHSCLFFLKKSPISVLSSILDWTFNTRGLSNGLILLTTILNHYVHVTSVITSSAVKCEFFFQFRKYCSFSN